MTRVPPEQSAFAETYMANARRIYSAMTGTTSLAALEEAERAADRQATKAELRMAIRSVQAIARQGARPLEPRADAFAVPRLEGARS